jgi:hypothetical protein
MKIETITTRDALIIRRQTLAPGEATHWHVDTCHRFSVVVRGNGLAIEYRDAPGNHPVAVHPGVADSDAPEPRVHRAINVGTEPFEEIVTFYLERPGTDPQPVRD